VRFLSCEPLIGSLAGINLVIEVRPSKKFKGAWVSFEASGVEPAFAAPDAKQKAINYACRRFGGGAGEVRVFDTNGSTIERSIVIDGRGQYPQVVR
jgi:hypothetical protein